MINHCSTESLRPLFPPQVKENRVQVDLAQGRIVSHICFSPVQLFPDAPFHTPPARTTQGKYPDSFGPAGVVSLGQIP
jgi:hypothetical protein